MSQKALTTAELRKLLDTYRKTQKGEGWHTAPDDGYLYDHLAHHLNGAGLNDELKGLFATPEWMRVRTAQRGQIYEGYLEDLQTASDAASQEYQQQVGQGEVPAALVDCVRYALINTTINSIAADYPPALVARAIELDIWTVKQAWSVVKKSPRLELYAALLSTGKLSPEQSDELITDAYGRVLHLRDHWQEQEAPWWPPSPTVWWFIGELITMLPHFSAAQRTELLQFDMKWLLGYGWGKTSWYPQTIEPILPHLSAAQIEQIAQEVEQMFHEHYRPRTMAMIVPYLPEAQQEVGAEKAYRMALNLLPYPAETARVIAKLLPHFEPSLQLQALAEAQKSAMNNLREDDRVRDATLLIPHVPQPERERFIQYVLEQALALDWGMGRSWELAHLYPYLEEEQRKQVFEILLAMPPGHGSHLTDIMSTVFSHLNMEQKRRAVQACYGYKETAGDIPVFNLVGLLPQAPDELAKEVFPELLKAMLDIHDEENYIHAVAALIPVMSPEDRDRSAAWVFARRHPVRPIYSASFTTHLFQMIGAYLPPDLLALAYQEAVGMSWSESPANFTSLLPRLTEKESVEAWNWLIAAYPRYESLHIALSELVPALVGAVRERGAQLTLNEILKRQPPNPDDAHFQAYPNGYSESNTLFGLGFAHSLRRIVPHLNPEAVSQAFNALMERTTDALCRAEGLVAFFPYLNETQRQRAILDSYNTIKAWDFRPVRENLLEPAAPYLTDEMKQDALQIAYDNRDVVLGVGIVRRLAPYLTEAQRTVALEWAFEHASLARTDNFLRAEVYARLAPHLDAQKRAEAVEKSYFDLTSPLLAKYGDVERKIEVLLRLVSAVDEPAQYIRTIHQEISDALMANRHEPRVKVLVAIQQIFSKLPPPLIPAKIHADIARQIIEICETWEWV